MVPTYVRPPPVFHKGEGCYLWDIENRRYLDWTAGIAVNALGHCDPGMSEILYQQSKTLVHCSNLYYNPWIGALSQLLVEKTRESGAMPDVSKAFICNSGSEANEAALKFARKVGKVLRPDGSKHEIVSFQNSFHGRTMGSLSMTPNPKYQKSFAPMIPGCQYGNYNDMEGISDLINESTCGVIVEPIQGEGGINVADMQWLQALRRRCREVGAVLIFDEIQCGLSRTGTLWAHAPFVADEVVPDILTTAKALGNGFPIGATLVTEEVAEKIVPGDHGTTYGGNPLACRVAHYVLTRLAEPSLQDHVVRQGERFSTRLRSIAERLPKGTMQDLRGRGLILGMQLNSEVAPVVNAARERGLLVINAGPNVLRFVPPLIISDQEIDQGMDILADALQVAFSPAGHSMGSGEREALKQQEEAPDT